MKYTLRAGSTSNYLPPERDTIEEYFTSIVRYQYMIWDILENYFVLFSVGLITGFFITRYYYEKNIKYSLGKIIEGVIISESIDDLQKYSNELAEVLMKMRIESDNLIDQIKRSRDIEKKSYNSETLDTILTGVNTVDKDNERNSNDS